MYILYSAAVGYGKFVCTQVCACVCVCVCVCVHVCVRACVSHKSLVFNLMPFCANALESVTNPALSKASGSSLSLNSTSGTTSWGGGGWGGGRGCGGEKLHNTTGGIPYTMWYAASCSWHRLGHKGRH